MIVEAMVVLVVFSGSPQRDDRFPAHPEGQELCGWCEEDYIEGTLKHRMDANGVIVGFCHTGATECDYNGHNWQTGRCNLHEHCEMTDDAESLLAAYAASGNDPAALAVAVSRGSSSVRVTEDGEAFPLMKHAGWSRCGVSAGPRPSWCLL